MVVRLATKWGSSEPGAPCEIRMSVLELALFMRVFRDENPVDPGDAAATISHWFECDVSVAHVREAADAMIRRGWMTHRDGGLRAAPDGRDHARRSLHGIVAFMNRGTKVIDAALMMRMLNIARQEVDPPYEEDLDPADYDLDREDAPDRWMGPDGWTEVNPNAPKDEEQGAGTPGSNTDEERGAAGTRGAGENDDDKG